MSEAQFFVAAQKITLRDTEVSVSPLAVKNISKAVKAAGGLIDTLSVEGINPRIILEHADEVITVCSLATDQSEEFVGNLNGAELLALLTLVVTVNSDFFVQAIMPQMTTLLNSVKVTAEKAKQDPKKLGKAA
jgi:hypothetical protein